MVVDVCIVGNWFELIESIVHFEWIRSFLMNTYNFVTVFVFKSWPFFGGDNQISVVKWQTNRWKSNSRDMLDLSGSGRMPMVFKLLKEAWMIDKEREREIQRMFIQSGFIPNISI